jgi:hypothetical protein
LTDTDASTPSDTITLNASDSFGNNAIPQTIAVTVAQALSLTVNDTDITNLPAAVVVSIAAPVRSQHRSIRQHGGRRSGYLPEGTAQGRRHAEIPGTGSRL